MKITENELLEAIRAACLAPGKAGNDPTSAEIATAANLTEDQVGRGLRMVARQGRLSCVRAPRTSIDGRRVLVPTYHILTTKKKVA